MIQPVSAVSAVRSVAPVRGHTTDAGGNFLAALQARQAAEAARTQPPTSQEKPVSSSGWTDEILAFFIGDGKPIDTTRTIDWTSAGDQKLTRNQIDTLKSRYNVDHLTPQEYYNLMSDLTHLGVLSGDDCMGVHLRHFGDEKVVFRPYTGPGHSIADFPKFRTNSAGKYLNSCIDFLMEELAQTKTAGFQWHNPHLNGSYVSGLEKDIAVRQKVAAVLDQLRG